VENCRHRKHEAYRLLMQVKPLGRGLGSNIDAGATEVRPMMQINQALLVWALLPYLLLALSLFALLAGPMPNERVTGPTNRA
jgi:hypothetical protein